MDPTVQAELVRDNGGRPAVRDAVLNNQELMGQLKAAPVFVPLFDTALPWAEPANHRWPEVNAAGDQVFAPVWTGAATPETGMPGVNRMLQEILSKSKA
jgi:hypothetical protein